MSFRGARWEVGGGAGPQGPPGGFVIGVKKQFPIPWLWINIRRSAMSSAANFLPGQTGRSKQMGLLALRTPFEYIRLLAPITDSLYGNTLYIGKVAGLI